MVLCTGYSLNTFGLYIRIKFPNINTKRQLGLVGW